MKLSQLLGRFAPILPAVVLLVLIFIHGVNVPFWDEWSTPGQFLSLEKYSFKDFFDQSNESRLIVPKLIFLGVSKLLGWQPKHYMVFGWVIVLAIFFLLYQLCHRRPASGRTQDFTSLLCLTISGALLFSPAAFENWLWGLQWVIFVPLLCALLALHIQNRTPSFGVRFGATVLLNYVAMYSFSNGMLLWVVSFPFWREGLGFLAGRRPSRAGMLRLLVWSSAYCLAALISVRIYFSDYQNISAHPPLAFVLKEPWSVVKYFAAWCGGPFHSNASVHIVVGFALILASLLLPGWLVMKARREPGWRTFHYLGRLYPSLLIIAYALGSGLMTSLGRAAFGVEQAFSSRYLFHSAALSVGLIAALNTHRILVAGANWKAGNYSRIFHGVLGLFSILLIRSWDHGYKAFEKMRIARTQTLFTVRMLAVVPKSPMVDKTCPWLDLPLLVKTLEEKGIYDPSSYGDWLTEAIKHPQSAAGGAVQILPRPQSEIGLTGWAMIPEHNTPADSVLLCRMGKSGDLEPCIMLAVGFKRNDIVREIGRSSLRHSGFMEVFHWPEEEDFDSVVMFSVDERNRRLYPLSRILP